MEKEIKDKNIILTDEELKEVAGGGSPKFAGCMHYRKIEECAKKATNAYGRTANVYRSKC